MAYGLPVSCNDPVLRLAYIMYDDVCTCLAYMHHACIYVNASMLIQEINKHMVLPEIGLPLSSSSNRCPSASIVEVVKKHLVVGKTWKKHYTPTLKPQTLNLIMGPCTPLFGAFKKHLVVATLVTLRRANHKLCEYD